MHLSPSKSEIGKHGSWKDESGVYRDSVIIEFGSSLKMHKPFIKGLIFLAWNSKYLTLISEYHAGVLRTSGYLYIYRNRKKISVNTASV